MFFSRLRYWPVSGAQWLCALRMGCIELHDRIMVGVRTEPLEQNVELGRQEAKERPAPGDPSQGRQYVFIGMAGTQKATIGWAAATECRKHDGLPA
jgi:hypothetical protein